MAILKSKQLSKNLSGSFTITGSLETTENISGSSTSTGSFGTIRVVDSAGGNINAVGTVSGSSTSTGSFGSVLSMGKVGIGTTDPTYELDVSGDVGVNRNIYHNDDDDTKLEFTSDRVRIDAGNITFLDIRNTSQDIVTVGASSDVDVKIQGGDGYVFVQGSDGFVGIKDDSPSYQLDVAGTGRFTEDLIVGGKVVAQEFHTEFVSASIQYSRGSTQFGDTEDDTHIFSGSISLNSGTTKEFLISGSGLLSGSSVTSASFGRIDTSGDIYSSGRIFEQNTSVIDHATAMAIVFGG